ncbi:MAG TPA: response regulator [Methylomirabilota bacterium]|jgi:DNA-binding NtrC family response regulator|nr:response regulator [Methylomirabilota bacterium]
MPDGAVARGSETILVTDDEADVREFVREVLEMHGYTVLVAPNAAGALEIAERHAGPIHLLLTDLIMPGIGGRDLALRLAFQRRGLNVLFMSGFIDDVRAHEGIRTGRMPFLEKPFRSDELARKVRQVLDAPRRACPPHASRADA